jgi:hypothetical protein
MRVDRVSSTMLEYFHDELFAFAGSHFTFQQWGGVDY